MRHIAADAFLYPSPNLNHAQFRLAPLHLASKSRDEKQFEIVNPSYVLISLSVLLIIGYQAHHKFYVFIKEERGKMLRAADRRQGQPNKENL